MLPMADVWYRRLLVAALGLGLAGGIFALVYSGVTGWGIRTFFGDPTSEPFSGEWWWIPLVSIGALVVALLRSRVGATGRIPGAVAFAQKGWVEPSSAFALVSISAISLMVGASLGPSFGIVVSGGGFAAWLVTRQKGASESDKQEYTLTGMAGGLGAVFSAPLFAAIMASELSPTSKRDYVSAFIPQFLAATIGGIVFFGVTGRMILDSFDIAGYDFAPWHLAAGLGLGLFSVVVLVLFASIERLVRRASGLITDRYVRALTFGALVGLIAFVLPLSAAAGSAQLSFATDNVGTLSAWLLAAVLVAKMLAVGLSLEAGFLGGTVFPLLFIGGTGGLLVNAVFPEIPASLAVASMIAGVPGALVGAPVSFILLGVGTVGIGLEGFGPIGIAVVTSHVTVSVLRLHRQAHGL